MARWESLFGWARFWWQASYDWTATRGTDGTGVRAFPEAAPTVCAAVLRCAWLCFGP